MNSIVESLKTKIKDVTGLMPVLAPQKAGGNTAMITLFFTGLTSAGERPGDSRKTANEEIDFKAVFSIAGTHKNWLNTAISHSRKLMQIIEDGGNLPFSVSYDNEGEKKEIVLFSQWSRNGSGQFVYDEEDRNMPVTYMEEYSVRVVYPAWLVGGKTDESDR